MGIIKMQLKQEFEEFDYDGETLVEERPEGRNETYLTDSVGAIATVLSIMAGIINLRAYNDAASPADEWKTVYLCELLWSGIVETGAIALVFITDSNLLRAIGGFSMVGVNTTSLFLINRANKQGTISSYTKAVTLHGIALGQAIGTFISTFIMADNGTFKLFGEQEPELEAYEEGDEDQDQDQFF